MKGAQKYFTPISQHLKYIEDDIHVPILTSSVMFWNNQILGWKMMQSTSKILICKARISVYAPARIVSDDAGQRST